MNFSQLPHMRTSISPDPSLVYIPLNMSICMRTFPHACRSCERSVSNPESFTCLKMRPELRRFTMNFSQLPHMRTSISPDPRLVYIPLNMPICIFKQVKRSGLLTDLSNDLHACGNVLMHIDMFSGM